MRLRPAGQVSHAACHAAVRSRGAGNGRSWRGAARSARAGPRTGVERSRSGSRSLLELSGRAQVSGAGPRVVSHLTRRRRHRAPGEQLSFRLAAAYAYGEIRRAGTAPRAGGEETLDCPVLERVKGDGGEPPVGPQPLPGKREGVIQLG